MTEEESVAWIAGFLTDRPTATPAEILAGLREAGLGEPKAIQAYNFTQLAWGRLVLREMGIALADWYTCFDVEGGIALQGRLLENPQFIAAQRLAPKYQGLEAFQKLALGSSETEQSLQMLNAGIPPAKIGMPPIYIMLGTPTLEGMERAQAYVASQSAADSAKVDEAAALRPAPPPAPPPPPVPAEPPPAKRPWWKLW